MKNLLFALIFLVLSACTSTSTGRPAIDLELAQALTTEAELAFRDTALAYADAEPALATRFAEIAITLDRLETQLTFARANHGDAADALASLDILLQLSSSMVDVVIRDPKRQAAVRASAIALRITLRAVGRSLGRPEGAEPSQGPATPPAP